MQLSNFNLNVVSKSSIMSSDAKYSIRKLEFHYWAREALTRIEQIVGGRNAPTSKQTEQANDLIREFVFCECDRRGNRRANGLSSLQELHLLDALCEYLSATPNETVRNAIFLSLFATSDAPKRMKVLCKLTSMAISASVAPVLLAISVWLQQTGCSSPFALQLAESVVRDYFVLHPANDELLKALPTIAPQFVANFMTAVIEMYLKNSPEGMFTPPPKSLLDVIAYWVSSDPTLCLSAQLHPAVFPAGTIPMVAVSPLPGLIQWCALAPLYIAEPTDTDVEITDYNIPSKKIKHEKSIDSSNVNSNLQVTSELDVYSTLYLGVLQSLYESRKLQSTIPIVNARNLANIVPPVLQRIIQLTQNDKSKDIQQNINLCVYRIAQASQIALSGGCVFGNIQHFLTVVGSLPENKMLKNLIKHHQKSS